MKHHAIVLSLLFVSACGVGRATDVAAPVDRPIRGLVGEASSSPDVVAAGPWVSCWTQSDGGGEALFCQTTAPLFAPSGTLRATAADGAVLADLDLAGIRASQPVAVYGADGYPLELTVEVSIATDVVAGFAQLPPLTARRTVTGPGAHGPEAPLVFAQPFELWPVMILAKTTEIGIELDDYAIALGDFVTEGGRHPAVPLAPEPVVLHDGDVETLYLAVNEGVTALTGRAVTATGTTSFSLEGPAYVVAEDGGLRRATAEEIATILGQDPTEDTDATCSDGIDNDGDGHVDCGDWSCSRSPDVTVCLHESDDRTCSDGQDNDQDGYLDCDDYDCSRNVDVTVCGEGGTACSNGVDDDRDGATDCDDPGCAAACGSCAAPGPAPLFVEAPAAGDITSDALTVSFATDVPVTAALHWTMGARTGDVTSQALSDRHALRIEGLSPGQTVEAAVEVRTASCGTATAHVTARTREVTQGSWRVLFDQAHAQTAGNADWIVDTSGRYPTPADPGRESDWTGAYSAFGFDLYETGRYEIEILPDGGTLTYGTSASQDLSGYDVLVMAEPNAPLVGGEAAAIVDFVRAGGGVLLIGDHSGSDRDGDGWDSVRVLNALLGAAPFGVSLGGSISGTALAEAGDPLLTGPFGTVSRLGCYVGSPLALDTAANPTLRSVARFNDQHTLVAAGTLGLGRFVVHGDSSAAEDGTDSGGNSNMYDNWNDPDAQNAAFFLNAAAWLAGEY